MTGPSVSSMTATNPGSIVSSAPIARARSHPWIARSLNTSNA